MAQAMGTLYKPCRPGLAPIDQTTVFDPETGELYEPPTPEAPSGSEITGSKCVLGGTPDNVFVVYFWTYHTPSSGLEPERSTSVVTSVGITDRNFRKEVVLSPDFPRVPDVIYPTEGGTVARYIREDAIVSIDPVNLKIKWRISDDGVQKDYDRTTFLVQQTLPTRVTVRDASSGKVLLDNIDEKYITDASTDRHPLSTGYFIEPIKGSAYYYNPTNGHKIELQMDGIGVSQQVNDTLLVTGSFDGGPVALRVFNIKSGETLFTLEDNNLVGVTGTNYNVSNYRNYLYIKNDSDSPVIDTSTRQKLSSGWRTRPVQNVGEDWVLIKRGQMDTEQCFYAGEPTHCSKKYGYELLRVGADGYEGPFH